MENMITMDDYLQMDGRLAFNIAIYNRFSSIEDREYSKICGGFIEGVHQWAMHNIDDVVECQNAKYVGYTIMFCNEYGYGTTEQRVYIPQWVMNITPKNWKHARALFNKYLREDVKFNNEQLV